MNNLNKSINAFGMANITSMKSKGAHILKSLSSARDFSNYQPLYSSCFTKQNSLANCQPTRWANTTSGYFAPSTLTSNRRADIGSQEPRGNINVFEDSDHLPSLPVPSLNNVLDKLKESISPIAMNSAEFAKTLQLIDEFSMSAGPKLDSLLRTKARQTKNWLAHDWWTDYVYMKSRQPLVINSNPSMIYPAFPFEVNSQRSLVDVISQLISGVIDFKLSLIHGYNPEATNADNECRLDPNLCYHQYQNLFGSTRMPGLQSDSQQLGHLSNNLENEPFSIIISNQGKFFEIQLNDIEDEKDRTDKLAGIIDKIIVSTRQTDLQKSDVELGAGVLTTANRSEWFKVYNLLDSDSLNALKGAQFVVCIDNIPNEPDEYLRPLVQSPIGSDQHSTALSRQILHADSANVGNRWFDKAFQLIIVADENSDRLLGAGINYEHSFGEGILATKLIEHSFDKTVKLNRDSACKSKSFFSRQEVTSKEPAVFRQLPMFNPQNESILMQEITKAKQDFLAQIGQFDLAFMNYKRYGSNTIKSWHFSPDSWFQVGLQLAYYNLHKRLGTCYESASTRRFAYGRTETIRSLTREVANFCTNVKYDTMQAAIRSHKAYALMAGNGNAIDRPLMGLKMTFDELKTNSWQWGLPMTPNGGNLGEQVLDRADMENYDIDRNHNYKLNDLFSEEEIHTITAFFNNELIKRSFSFALSTSQVSSIHPNICMTYGPILADGYGVCYNITGQQIVAAITANSSNQSFSCEVSKLNDSIKDSLNKMGDLAEEQNSKN